MADEEPKPEQPVEAQTEAILPVETPAETSSDASAADATEAPSGPLSKAESNKPRVPRIPLPSSLQEIVGALLFASESPLSATELRACVRGVAPEEGDDAEVMSVYQSCTSREIEQALRGLEKELERSGCGFRLICTGGTYRLQTASSCGRYVRALLKLDRPNRLSRASLETLAIIAYRQPITKAEIEQIRGVAVDTIVKSLVDLQLVRLVGRSELPGHPFLYGTSPLFLEHFGLASLSELNAIDPTLQRSNPRERAKLFVKEKKPETQEPPATEEAPSTETSTAENETAPTEPPSGEAPAETGDVPRRVSFRPDEEELIDDTPDESAEGGDESLVDDDDEPLVDDEEESLVDDEDDDESLVDDDDEDDDEDSDDEDEESEEAEEEGEDDEE